MRKLVVLLHIRVRGRCSLVAKRVNWPSPCALLIMKFLLCVLLYVCFAVAGISSQLQTRDVPYVHFMGVNLTNHSYVDVNNISNNEMEGSLECRTDLQTCCHQSDGGDSGDWFAPNGVVLPRGFIDPTGLYFNRRSQSLKILYGRIMGHTPVSGIYQCTVETNAVNSADNSARETVYVGIYNSSEGMIMYSYM